MKRIALVGVVAVYVIICIFLIYIMTDKEAVICYAEEYSDTDDIDSYDYKDIDKTVKEETGIDISYSKIMKALINNREDYDYIRNISSYISGVLYSEKNDISQVLCLCILSALINVLTPFFNEKQLKDTAAGVISAALITILLSVFMGTFYIAQNTVTALINIYKAISMVFFPAVCASGAPASAVGYYQIVIWMIMAADICIKHILMNADRVYVCISLCDCIDSESHFSRLSGCIQKAIKWCGYSMLTIFMGLNGIKSIVSPVKDSINTSYVYKAVSVIPGIGDAASILSQTIIASSALIKNTMGAAAVIVLVICMLFPLAKLIVISCIYQGISAIMEPIADKRIIKAVSSLGTAVSSLTYLIVISSVLFILTIVIICIATS